MELITKLKKEYESLEKKIKTFFDGLQNNKRLENDISAYRCAAELIYNRIDRALLIFK